ncbi:MAG: hypothetical protein IK024_07995 [Treponema sp.]|nr:hypothetical protein [Treponema sp.]
MTVQGFKKFRTDFISELKKQNNAVFLVNYPPINNNELFFWVTSLGTGIGSELCHYEFVTDKKSNVIDLEVHFEFQTANDNFSCSRILQMNTLLSRQIRRCYPFSKNSLQVGIKYKSLDPSSNTIKDDALYYLTELDRQFRKKFPKILKKL